MMIHTDTRKIGIFMILLAVAALGVQTGARVPQAAPAAALLPVAFRATDASGAPIPDLKPGEVTIKVTGRARAVRSLDLVRLADEGQTGTVAAALPPPFASNSAADNGRAVYFVVEDDSVAPGREAEVRDAVGAMLDTMSGRDRAGLLVMSHGKLDVGLTSAYDSVRSAMAKFDGRARRAESTNDTCVRTVQTVGILTEFLDRLDPQSPTAVVFVSAGLSLPSAATVQLRNSGASSGVSCDLRRDVYDLVGVSVARSLADLYVVLLPADKGIGTSSSVDAEAGIQNLAGASGHGLIRLGQNVKTELARVTRAASAYYVATVETDGSDKAGTSAHVDLKVSRDGVKVAARAEVAIPKGAGGKGAQVAKDLLRVATAAADVTLRAVSQTARGASGDLVQVVIFEPADSGQAFSTAAVGLYDDKGKLASSWVAQPADLAARTIMAAIPTKAGAYRMRVAVTDANGRAGTVDHDVRVELAKGEGELLASTLTLGAPTNGAFAPRLQFRGESVALAYFEIYGVPSSAAVTAVIELAATADGPASTSAPARVGNPGNDGRRIVVGQVPVAALRPGEYAVRAIISVDGKPAGRVTRTLRKLAQ